MSKINFKKSRIKKKYQNLKVICYFIFTKNFGCPEPGEHRALLKTHLYVIFQNCFLTQKKF